MQVQKRIKRGEFYTEEEAKKILSELNVAVSQLPRINITDAALPEKCNVGDIIKIERKSEDGTHIYYRVVV